MNAMNPPPGRLMVVSNRLPVVLKQEGKSWRGAPGSGGLVTALAPVLQARGGTWIGWPGTLERRGIAEAMRECSQHFAYDLVPVELSEALVQGYYYGFANEILWPLLHGFETRCNFDPAYWQAYADANQRFAQAVQRAAQPGDYIWVHDYQLMLVAALLREAGLTQRMGYFHHIPFPAPEVFFKLPWRARILAGLLAFDLVGFQTLQDRRNFTACLSKLRLPGFSVQGRGDVVSVQAAGREVRAGSFPISIDFRSMNRLARSAEVETQAARFKADFGQRHLIVSIDRLDYTKGIPHRLRALDHLLQSHPRLRDKLCLAQVCVPSREGVPEYERLRSDIERRVGELNGRYTSPGSRVPLHYLHRSISRAEVAALLRAADLALVTPLRDGMNLVAKEYVACQPQASGVLVLSEFAGAAAELSGGALLVNPYDFVGTGEAILRALEMSQEERRRRMHILRAQVARHDVFRWVNAVLDAALAKSLADFPRREPVLHQPPFALDAEGGA